MTIPADAFLVRGSGSEALPPLPAREHLLRRQAAFARPDPVGTGELDGVPA